MTLEQAHAGMRAGMEIGDKLRGNVWCLCRRRRGRARERGAGAVAPDRQRRARPVVSGPHMDAA
jgi:nicotinate-nucleotide--dimethylbenzimidazole phosphoribosyltransferase